MKEYNFQFPKYGKLKLKSIWQKGEDNKGNRYLMEQENGKELMLWVELTNFPLDGHMQVEIVDVTPDMYKKSDMIKNRYYNYYLLQDQSDKETKLEKEIEEWLKSGSFFPENLNSFVHVKIEKINYKPVIY